MTIGRTYVVLGVEADVARKPLFRIVGDDGHTPGLYEVDLFTVVSPQLAKTWVCAVTDDGGLQFGPAPWLRNRFWEDYFDGVPDAVADFEREFKALILAANAESVSA
jgi:hypothetical protein